MNWQPWMNGIKNETGSLLVEEEDVSGIGGEGGDKSGGQVVVVVVQQGQSVQQQQLGEQRCMEPRIEEEEVLYLLEWHAQRRRLGQGCRGCGSAISNTEDLWA